MSYANKILFKKSQIGSKKKIKKFLMDPKIARIVDNLKERNEMMRQFKEYNKGGITKGEARKILGKFYYNRNDSLDRNETNQLAKIFGLRGAHKYERPISERGDRKNSDVNFNEKISQRKESRSGLLQDKIKNNSDFGWKSSNSVAGSNKKNNFSSSGRLY